MIENRKIPLLSYLHDHQYHGHFYGEVFVDENVLWYFDGVYLRVIGYDVDLVPVDRSRFLRILEIVKSKFYFEQVTFESPKIISIKRPFPEFERIIINRPKSYDHEIFVTPQSSHGHLPTPSFDNVV